MSLAALILALALQPAMPEPGTVPDRALPYTHEAGGFALTLPEGWRYFPLEDASGIALLHEALGARIEAFAVAVEPSGVPGLPDDTLDALVLRLDGPGLRRGTRVRVPLVVAGESASDRQQAGDVEALSYTGSSATRRWSGVATTRCGADILLTLEADSEAFEQAAPAFEGVRASWGLLLTGGADFPCG